MPLYCLAAGKQCKRLREFAQHENVAMRQWLFVDDFIFQAAPAAVPMLVAEYERICSMDGIVLVRDKCKAYWPSYAHATREGEGVKQQWMAWHGPQLLGITGAIRVTTDHITVLGNALGGD